MVFVDVRVFELGGFQQSGTAFKKYLESRGPSFVVANVKKQGLGHRTISFFVGAENHHLHRVLASVPQLVSGVNICTSITGQANPCVHAAQVQIGRPLAWVQFSEKHTF